MKVKVEQSEGEDLFFEINNCYTDKYIQALHEGKSFYLEKENGHWVLSLCDNRESLETEYIFKEMEAKISQILFKL